MPGPRLEARLSNPQAHVAANGPNPFEQLAPLVRQGMALYEDVQEGKDDKYLADLEIRIAKLNEGIDQGVDPSVLAGNIAKERIQALKDKPWLREEIASIAAQGQRGAYPTRLRDVKAAEAANVEKARVERNQRYTARGIPVDHPDRAYLLKVGERANLKYNQLDMENKIDIENGKIDKRADKRVANALIADEFHILANSWDAQVSLKKKGAITAETVGGVLDNMDSSIKNLKAQLKIKFADTLSDAELNEMAQVVQDERDYVAKVLQDDNLIATYEKRKKLRDSVADFITNPTPEAKALSDFIDKVVTSRHGDLLLQVVGDDYLRDAVEGQIGRFTAALMSSGVTEGLGAWNKVGDATERSRIAANIVTFFMSTDVDLSDDTVQDLANMLSNTTGPMVLDKDKYGQDAWTALMAYAASGNGKKQLADPRFQGTAQTISSGFSGYTYNLLKQSNKFIADNLQGIKVIVKNGKIDAQLDMDAKVKGAAFVSNRAIEEWRQRYGTRINTLAQASANLGMGTVEENTLKLAGQLGYTPDTDIAVDDTVASATATIDAAYGSK